MKNLTAKKKQFSMVGETNMLNIAQIILTKKRLDKPSLNVNLMVKILNKDTQKASAESI
jgi:hypothetical protein